MRYARHNMGGSHLIEGGGGHQTKCETFVLLVVNRELLFKG